jgi:enoyl-CoA hydratase
MNLLSRDALFELGDLLNEKRETKNEQRLLVFRSSRPNLFAAGADMAEMRDFSPRQAEEFSRAGQELFSAIENLPIVTVALIGGDCFGGALDLVMAFDFRFATPRSRFAHPGARIGIVTGFGGTTRWRKLLSRPAANTLFLGNEVLKAEGALAAGLIDRVGDDFEDELKRLETADPAAVRFVKELTIHADRLSRSQLLLLARRLGNLYFGGPPWSR